MRRLIRFFREGLWETDLRQRALPVRVLYSTLRVVSHVWLHYDRHHIGVRAAGLTMFTLLSIVPLLAIAFGAAEGFGYRAELQRVLETARADSPAYLAEVLARVEEIVSRTSFRGLGLVGSLVLAWTALTMFVRTEQSLNVAFRSVGQRSWLTRLTSFIALVVLVPLLLLGALLMTSALESGPIVAWLRAELPWTMVLYEAGLWLLPYLMAIAAFTALYRFMPSVPVRFLPAQVAGAITGTALIVMHELYVALQVGVARNNEIYLALAVLPLLILYLQAVWTVVLVGAEIAYAVQNLHLIGPGRDLDRMAPAVRERLGLRLAQEVGDAFAAGRGAIALGELAARVDVPVEWLQMLLEDLQQVGVLLPVRGGRAAPARPPAEIPLDRVVRGARGAIPRRLEARLALRADLAAELDAAFAAATARLATARLVARATVARDVDPASELADGDADAV
ncbi:MAG: YihY/virulence factor BrkB family protein [Planctomycetes bacterium]|nr:YihY/virulence factor BrkB family protein [Planctomycetota bacterium]